MMNRIFKDWKTSLIGLLIIALAAFLLWEEVMSEGSALVLMVAGLALLGVKDPRRNVLPVLLIASSFGCKTVRIAQSNEIRDSTILKIVERTDTVLLPGAEIPYKVFINCDSAGRPYMSRTKGGTEQRNIYHGNGEAFNEMTLDPMTGVLSGIAGCDSLMRELQRRDSTIIRMRFERTGTHTTELVKEMPWWGWTLIGGMGLCVLILGLKTRI